MDIRLKDIMTTYRDNLIVTAGAYNALGAIAATEGNIELVNLCARNALEFIQGAEDTQEQIKKLTEEFGAEEAKPERYKILHEFNSRVGERIFDTRDEVDEFMRLGACNPRCKIVPESEWDAY